MVTGAAGSGMGRSIALSLAREGVNVVVNYNNSKEEAEEIVRYVNQNNMSAIALSGNVFIKKDCKRLVRETINKYAKIDILIIGPGSGWNVESIDQLNTEKSLSDIVNEVSPIYNFFPEVLPLMYQQKWGRIIGISVLSTPPSPAYSYNVAKLARTKALLSAVDQAWEKNVTINVISPGPVTHIKGLDKAINLAKKKDEWNQRDSITPQDVAETVVFLCSEEARYISGTNVNFKYR